MIPEKFRSSGQVLVNYDFADLLGNVGYVTLYALDTEGNDYLLCRQALISAEGSSQITGVNGSIERNFDYEFLSSQYVKGDLYVSITIFVDGFGANTATNDTTVEIFHVDAAAAETSIGTQQSIIQITNPINTDPTEYRTTLKFDVDKMFSKGDKLRIEVISTVASGNANSYAGFYHHGDNTTITGVGYSSNLICLVPFDLGGKL